jgi:hypothetical protein
MKQLGLSGSAEWLKASRHKALKVHLAGGLYPQYGGVVPGCPELSCPCGNVKILRHARGVYFFYDACLPLGDRTVRAPRGPQQGAPYYFSDLEVAVATMARQGCALHGGDKPEQPLTFDWKPKRKATFAY